MLTVKCNTMAECSKRGRNQVASETDSAGGSCTDMIIPLLEQVIGETEAPGEDRVQWPEDFWVCFRL